MAAIDTDASKVRCRLPPGCSVDSMGRVKLTRELLVALYQDQGLTQREVAAATGWATYTVLKRLRALGVATRRRGRRSADEQGSGEMPLEESVAEKPAQAGIVVEAPDGTLVVLNDSQELAVFQAVVKLYTDSYSDWTAPPDRQMVTNLARLQVNIHRLEEEFRGDKTRDPKRLKDITDLMARQAAFHKELGISRPQRQASREKETADAWLQRILEAHRRYDGGDLPEAIP